MKKALLKSNFLILEKVKNTNSHIKILFDILKKRSSNSNISHSKLPTLKEHKAFVYSKPYRFWFLIKRSEDTIGSVYITRYNEISIKLIKHNTKIYKDTLLLIIKNIKPLKGIASKRNKSFLINVSAKDKKQTNLLSKLRLRKIQETFKLDGL